MLIRAYLANAQIQQAVSLLENVVEIREITLTKEHSDRLASQHVLIKAYLAKDQIKQAVTLLEHVIKIGLNPTQAPQLGGFEEPRPNIGWVPHRATQPTTQPNGCRGLN